MLNKTVIATTSLYAFHYIFSLCLTAIFTEGSSLHISRPLLYPDKLTFRFFKLSKVPFKVMIQLLTSLTVL